MNWLYYLAEANLYLGAFYLCYFLLLKRETHYTLNRVFLLLSCMISLLLPLIQLDFLKTEPMYANGIAYITEVEPGLTWEDGLLYSYFTGVLILSIQFAVKLYQLHKLTRQNALVTDGYKLIYLDEANTAFSFFNYLFIGTQTPQPDLVTQHELVHIRQKHSADIVFLELFKIVNWFNPLVYLLQNSLKTVHEYIADEQTATHETDALTYSTFLVNNAYGLTGSSITHSFYNYNLLKNRIIMLNQKRSGNLARLKYLLAVPLCAGLLCESTLGFSKTYGFIDIGTKKASALAADTIKKSIKTKTATVRFSPDAPTPVVSKVKFPPPRVKKVKVTDVKLLPPPPPPEPPVRKVKAKKAVKLSEIRIDEPKEEVMIRIDEPVQPATKPLQEVRIIKSVPETPNIRIDEPISAKKSKPLQEVRIKAMSATPDIRIDEPVPAKKGERSTFSIGTKN